MNEILAPFSPSLPAKTKPCGHTNTSLEWEAQRAEITRLYTFENLTLKDVVEIMKVQYSFSARWVPFTIRWQSFFLILLAYSERQYKSRIAQWGLDKKVKQSEMKAIIRIEWKRKTQEGKDTCFRVRKRPVDPKKIKRFTKDHPNIEPSSLKSR